MTSIDLVAGDWKKRWKDRLVAAATVIIILLLAFGRQYWAMYQEFKDLDKFPPMPDTIFIPKPYKVFVKVPAEKETKPARIEQYQVPDTARRKAIEKDTLLGGVTLKDGLLQVDKLTPLGINIVNSYPVSPYSKIDIASNGMVMVQEDTLAKKKARRSVIWTKVRNTGKDVGLVLLGVAFGKAASN